MVNRTIPHHTSRLTHPIKENRWRYSTLSDPNGLQKDCRYTLTPSNLHSLMWIPKVQDQIWGDPSLLRYNKKFSTTIISYQHYLLFSRCQFHFLCTVIATHLCIFNIIPNLKAGGESRRENTYATAKLLLCLNSFYIVLFVAERATRTLSKSALRKAESYFNFLAEMHFFLLFFLHLIKFHSVQINWI